MTRNRLSGKCIVTGGAGFIGSHLTELLVERGCEVVVIDDFANGGPHNLEHLSGSGLVSLHQMDVCETDQIRPLFSGAEYVFHLAALADIVPSIENPVKYYEANVTGTVSVLEAARSAKIKKLVYAASSSCYGIPETYPTPETERIQPKYPYALTKYLGEQCVLHWSEVYDLPAISLRLFNVYGPRSRTSGTYGAVFGVFLAQKIAGRPYTVVGDGKQTRDFTFVSDVARAFVAAAESDRQNEVFNVGSGDHYSVNRLVQLLGGDVVHIPKRPGEPDQTFAATEKIKHALGWKPQVPFEDGVKIMLDNIHYWRDAPVWDKDSIAKATRDWFRYLGREQAE